MILYPVKNSEANTIGGKAKGLLQLMDKGVSVPPFLVIPAEMFDAIIQQGNGNSALIRNGLLQFSLPPKDLLQIEQIVLGWKLEPLSLIVRSSVGDEDGTQDAFAGLMDSFSNIKNLEDLPGAIARCAASAYSERAIAYRKQKGLTLSARSAVIVQQQLVAEVSGVIFTTYPTYPQEMAIHAVWGLGEGLVNGELDADEFYLLKKNGTLNRQNIAVKKQERALKEDNGTGLMDVEKELQEMPCLTERGLQEIFTAASLLEEKFGHPQDIEFVLSDNHFYFVQSRPITQKIPAIVVYDNSNIQESYCGVTTPLTFSFAQRAYATVYRQTMALLSLPQKTMETYEPVVANLLGLIKGRIYYNINNWYRGLQLLPSFKQNKEDMERMMGVEEPVDFITDTEKTFTEKLTLLPSLLRNLLKLLSAFTKLPQSVSQFHAHFRKQYERFYEMLPLLENKNKIVAKRKILDKELLQNWTTPIINDFYVMMMNGRVRRKLSKAGITEPEAFLSRYFSGNQQIASAQPAIVMQQLALKAAQQLPLHDLLLALPDKVHEEVQKRFPEFYSDVQAYIQMYGDRTVGELKLETITMRLSPQIFYNYLRNYLMAPNALEISAQPHLQQSAKKDLEERLHNQNYFLKKSVYKSLHRLQKAIQFREAMRLERTRLFGMYRALYIKAGSLLFTEGKLKSPRDIFYLSENEIELLLQGETALETTAMIAERKVTFELYKKEEVPARVVVPSPPSTTLIASEKEDELMGTGCVPGTVTAEIIVITGPEDNLDVSGKIVCALRTDPGWVALFPACKGVLIEKGSALSHSVILLREFGIPAIINIAGLTKKLKSGQMVTMDGSSGQITLVTF